MQGESSRSVQERALEHWGAAGRRDPKNHMFKHQCNEHVGEEPKFMFKVVSHHRTALGRQVKEAVRIRRRGGESRILNSRGEYNWCHIPRLVIEEEDEETKNERLRLEKLDTVDRVKTMDKDEQTWERKKSKGLESKAEKRRRFSEGPDEEPGGRRKPGKKLKFSLIAEDWGEIVEECGGEQLTGGGPKTHVAEEVPVRKNICPPPLLKM